MQKIKLKKCKCGDVIQFLDDSGNSFGRCKGIVVAQLKTRTKVLEFEGVEKGFDGLLTLSSIQHNFDVVKLDYKLNLIDLNGYGR